MSWFRRLFPDPNVKIPCADCGAMILRRTAKENGGLCAPCARMTPERRAARRTFDAALADGSQFRLTTAEKTSARPLTAAVPPPETWIAHPEDMPHGAGKTVASVVALARAGAPSIHLRSADNRYLSLEQEGAWAILTTADPNTPEIHFVHGPAVSSGQIPADAQLWLACPCPGQGSVTAPSKFHLPRAAALAALDHILNGTAPAHLQWVTADPFDFVTPGRG